MKMMWGCSNLLAKLMAKAEPPSRLGIRWGLHPQYPSGGEPTQGDLQIIFTDANGNEGYAPWFTSDPQGRVRGISDMVNRFSPTEMFDMAEAALAQIKQAGAAGAKEEGT